MSGRDSSAAVSCKLVRADNHTQAEKLKQKNLTTSCHCQVLTGSKKMVSIW